MSLKPPETRSAVLETLLLQKVFAGAGSLSNDGMRASGSDAFSTFGFRGEALSAICAMGDMTIATKTANESAAAWLSKLPELRRHPCSFCSSSNFQINLLGPLFACVRS